MVKKEKNKISDGWDAIDLAFKKIYPRQANPLHYSPSINYNLGGKDPLDGVSIYDGGDFWHFVTYGFSELYEKETDNSERSGFGFELTMKLKKVFGIDESELKNIVGVLQSLARYVFSSGKGFAPYHYIYTKQKEGFDIEKKSKLTGFATFPDIAGIVETPNGKVEFICLVGLTDKELQSIYEKKHTTKEILELFKSDLTDYTRGDII